MDGVGFGDPDFGFDVFVPRLVICENDNHGESFNETQPKAIAKIDLLNDMADEWQREIPFGQWPKRGR